MSTPAKPLRSRLLVSGSEVAALGELSRRFDGIDVVDTIPLETTGDAETDVLVAYPVNEETRYEAAFAVWAADRSGGLLAVRPEGAGHACEQAR